MGVLSQIVRAVIFCLAVQNITSQQVQTTEIGSNRYFFSDSNPFTPRLNWFLAYQYCRSIGMDLLSMQSKEEADLVIDHLKQHGKSQQTYWTSGNQLGSTMWIWMTLGKPFNSTFHFWSQNGPPLTKSDDGCLQVMNGIWAASNCMDDNAFICHLSRCYFFNYANTRRISNQGTTSKNSNTSDKQKKEPEINTEKTTSTTTLTNNFKNITASAKFKQMSKLGLEKEINEIEKLDLNNNSGEFVTNTSNLPEKTKINFEQMKLDMPHNEKINEIIPEHQKKIPSLIFTPPLFNFDGTRIFDKSHSKNFEKSDLKNEKNNMNNETDTNITKVFSKADIKNIPTEVKIELDGKNATFAIPIKFHGFDAKNLTLLVKFRNKTKTITNKHKFNRLTTKIVNNQKFNRLTNEQITETFNKKHSHHTTSRIFHTKPALNHHSAINPIRNHNLHPDRLQNVSEETTKISRPKLDIKPRRKGTNTSLRHLQRKEHFSWAFRPST